MLENEEEDIEEYEYDQEEESEGPKAPATFDSIPLCPVFRPTMEEFKDFAGYLEKCVAQIGTIGLLKVSTHYS